MKSKRSKACDISKKVKEIVFKRDNGLCIFCGRQGIPNAHFIPRSAGGLGIEENIFTACIICHNEQDNGKNTKKHDKIAEAYLKSKYKNWNKKDLIYDKWRMYK